MSENGSTSRKWYGRRTFLLTALLAVVAVAVIAVVLVIAAQDDGTDYGPLLDMLALVPDTETVRAGEHVDRLSYVDYRAIGVWGDTVVHPAGPAEFEALDEDAEAVWRATLFRVHTGPRDIMEYLFVSLDTLSEVVGFSFFDIDRGMYYGRPPDDVTVFAGAFDTDAIAEVYGVQEYTSQEMGDITVWQHPDGMDPQFYDLRNRNPANPFGGDLGRKQPLAIIPGDGATVYLASSPDWELVEDLIGASQENQPSLAEADDYRTLAEAISDPDRYTGTLVQAQFLDPTDEWVFDHSEVTRDEFEANPLLSNSALRMGNELSPEEQMEWFERLGLGRGWCNASALPPYTLAVIADRQEGEDQVAIAALLYEDEESAQTAAEELGTRLPEFSDEITTGSDEPFINRLEGASVDEPYLYTSKKTGMSAAVVAIRYPLPAEVHDEDGMLQTTGMLFRFWMRAIERQTFTPLTSATLADWMGEAWCDQ